MANCRTESFKLENMRASYVNVLKPRKTENDDKTIRFEYQITLLYPKSVGTLMGKLEDGTPINVGEACMKIAREHWGEKTDDLVKAGILKTPFLDGDGPQAVNNKTGVRNPGYAGMKFIRCKSKASEDRAAPAAFGANLGADGKLVAITNANDLYSGCYVHAVVNAFTWENDKGGRGISFGFSMVQFAKDGERLGSSGADPNSFFEGVPPAVVDAAKTAAATNGQGAANLFT